MARIMCAVAVFMIAATVLQAAALEVPHVTKSLGETKTRQLGKLSMKDPSSMLTELEEMVHSGETPTFDVISVIKSTIQDDIMPGLQATRGAAANDTIDFLDAIDLCNDESKARADQIAGSTQVLVNIARSAHAVCRDAQKTMYHHNLTSPESYCVKLGKFLHETEPLSIEDGMTRADAVDYVKSNSMNSNMCARSEVCELDDNCTQKEEELRIKEVECLQKQKDFEEAFCTWKAQLELNCQELDRCHSTAQTAYQHHVDKTEILLEKWNVETAALQKILCYCNVWLSDMDDCDNRSQHNVTQFDVCKNQTYTPVPVDHGTPADKASCPLTSVECHPGKSCFHQEYSGFADFVAPVVPCMQTATTTTAVPTQGDTILTENVSAGSTEIEVNNPTGFQVGQTVDIDPGTAVHETNVISQFGSIIFVTPLVFNHSIYARVVGQAHGFQDRDNSHEPCASVCGGRCNSEADADKPECAACASCHDAHEPCAAACPEGCHSWDDADKPKCTLCAMCHRATDPCSETCWHMGCDEADGTISKKPECSDCVVCHTLFQACDGKAATDKCDVWLTVQNPDSEHDGLKLAQNNYRQPGGVLQLKGQCVHSPPEGGMEAEEGPFPAFMQLGNSSPHEALGPCAAVCSKHCDSWVYANNPECSGCKACLEKYGCCKPQGATCNNPADYEECKSCGPCHEVLLCWPEEPVRQEVQACEDKQYNDACSFSFYPEGQILAGSCSNKPPPSDGNGGPNEMHLMGVRGGGRQGGGRHRFGGISVLGHYGKKGDEKASSVLWCEPVVPWIEVCRDKQYNDDCSFSPSLYSEGPEYTGRCTNEVEPTYENEGPMKMLLMGGRGDGRQGGGRHRGGGLSILGSYTKKGDEKASSVLWCKPVLPYIEACRGKQDNEDCSFSVYSEGPQYTGHCTNEAEPTYENEGPMEMLLMGGRGGGRQGGGSHRGGGINVLGLYAKKGDEKASSVLWCEPVWAP